MITIDIQEINNAEDAERFFILLEMERILWHPEMSFHGFIEPGRDGRPNEPLFSDEEAERLDQLMGKCRDLHDDGYINIWHLAELIRLKVRGFPIKWN